MACGKLFFGSFCLFDWVKNSPDGRCSGNTLASQNPAQIHFGLDDCQRVQSLTIRWSSGTVQKFSGIPANQHIQITEGSDNFETMFVNNNHLNMLQQANSKVAIFWKFCCNMRLSFVESYI